MTSSHPLLGLTPELRVTYEIGSEHSPVDPFGKTTLMLEGSGTARLDVRKAGMPPRSWEARVSTSALTELLEALRRGGFPEGSQQTFVPDTPIAQLLLERQAERAMVRIDRYKAAKLPGYREAYAILDSLAWQLSGGETAPVTGTTPVPGAISEVTKLFLH